MMSAEPVNGADAAWLRLDSPSNLLVITALAVTETMSLAAFRELVSQRFLSFQRFRFKPALHSGMYFWEDYPDLALEQHVVPVSLPGPWQ
jgi:diacylglycerol O-acyltransferase